MLTDAWTPLRPHKEQSELWRSTAQFVGVPAGRGSGKTELARRRIVRFLPVKKDWPDPMYFYALPTFSQARRVAWKHIKRLVPEQWLAKPPNETELIIETKFGSSLYVVGMDKPQRLEGNQWDGGVIDESCDQKPRMFDLTVLPALSHKRGWCWRIGVPKRFGVGANDFREFCKNAGRNGDTSSASFTWTSETILEEHQLRWAKDHLDARDYAEQYLAQWESVSGQIFYGFDEVLNVREVQYDPRRPILIGSDFNVDPMCWVIGQEIGAELHIIDEIVGRNTNTPQTLQRLYERYGNHKSGFEFYGDASGKARKTSASMSDYVHILNDTRFSHKSVRYLDSNPKVTDRMSCCNLMFCSASHVRKAFIHPRCKRLLADLRDRAWKEGTLEPNDSADLGHMSDALGYLMFVKYPMRIAQAGVSQVSVGDNY